MREEPVEQANRSWKFGLSRLSRPVCLSRLTIAKLENNEQLLAATARLITTRIGRGTSERLGESR